MLARKLFHIGWTGATPMGKKILIIDESAMLRRIAASVLGSQIARYEVLAATRAAEGFAQACASSVDLILVDQRLLDLHGEDLTKRLLADARTARIPVVLLIGRSVDLPPLDILSANVVETLRKPFAPEQLVASVNSIIELANTGAGFAELRAQLHPVPRTEPATPSFRAAVEETSASWTAKPVSLSAATEPVKRGRPPSGSDTTSPRAALYQAVGDRLTGSLHFRASTAVPVDVLMENGRIVVVTTHDGAAYSEDASQVLPPKVSPATLEAAMQEQCSHGIPFFLTLGARGLLSKAAAEALLHRFGQRCFARLWTTRPADLSCESEAMDTLPGFALRLEPRREPLDEWLLGTLRHLAVDDLEEISYHDGLVGTPYFLPGGETILYPLPLTVAERNFAHLVNGRSDLPSISRTLGLLPEAAFLMLFRLRCLEAMGYRPAPEAFMVTPRTSLRRVLPLQR